MRLARRVPRTTVRRSLIASVATVAASVTVLAAAVPPVGADELTDKRAQAEQVATKLDSLEAREMQLSAEAEKAKGDLSRAEAAVADAQERADEANAELAVRQDELRDFAVDAYVTGSDNRGVDAMLTSAVDDSATVRGYVTITGGSRQDLIDRLNATRLKAQQEGEELEAARGELEARNAQLTHSLDAAQSAVDEQQTIKDRLDGEVATLVAAEQARKAAAQQAVSAAPQGNVPSGGGGGGGAAAPVARPSAPAPAPAPAPSGPAPPMGSGAGAAIAAAMSKIGSPYVWAAAGPNTFDCSGFTMWAWAHGGKSLSHYTGSQLAQSRRISAGEAQPGDLVFFWGPGDGGDPGHVGLYLGGGSFIHAPGTGKFVRIDSVGYWSGARVAYGRV
jgi:cell wall-associated NlpC family hydrolase